jgi:CRP-like cAMP-binding protein
MLSSHSTSLVTFLRSVPVFGGLEGHSLERLIDLLEERTFDSGESIFNEGELGRTMYVLREGEVEVSRRSDTGHRVPIVRLGSGETFGEMTLVELQPRSGTVVARKRSRTYSLTNMDLYNLYREDNYAYVIILQNICRMLSRRLRKADSRIVEFIDAVSTPKKSRLKLIRSKASAAAKKKR